jgi:DNA-binding MarR family transcriptional regulator
MLPYLDSGKIKLLAVAIPQRLPPVEHRRIRRISLTPEGSRLLQQCNRRLDCMEKQLFGELSAFELEALRSALAKLIGSMRSKETEVA